MGADKTEFSPKFAADFEKVKQIETVFEGLAKKVAELLDAMGGFSTSTVALNEAFAELVANYRQLPEEVLQMLRRLVQLNKDVEQCRQVALKQIDEKASKSLSAFVAGDVEAAKRARKAAADAKVQMDAADKTVQSLLTAKVDKPLELVVQYTHYHYAKRKFEARTLEAENAMEDVIVMKDYEGLAALIGLYDPQYALYMMHYEWLSRFAPMMDALGVWSETLRADATANLQAHVVQRSEVARRRAEARYFNLTMLLAAPDLALINALCMSCGAEEQKEMMDRIVRVLDSYRMTLPILDVAIREEVQRTSSPSVLFRENIISTRLMSTYVRLSGSSYLHKLLPMVLEPIFLKPELYEMDPTRVSDATSLASNAQELENTCGRLMNAILNSMDILPLPLRYMALSLSEEVVKKYPDAQRIAIGGFLFLRILCPAISSPDTSGIVSFKLNDLQRRACVLVSKVMQNIANGLEFGAKEAFMTPLNPFVSSYLGPCLDFFRAMVANLDKTDIANTYVPLSSAVDSNAVDLPWIHAYAVSHLEVLCEKLTSYKHTSTINPLIKVIAQISSEKSSSS